MKRYRWADLTVGMTASFEVVVSERHMALFRELSGDENPLHADPAFAARAGHPSPVVFGMLTSSFYSTLVGVHLPGELALLHGIDLDFHRPVYVGARLTVAGEITFLSDAVRRIQIQASLRDEAGNAISRAKIRVGLLEHPEPSPATHAG